MAHGVGNIIRRRQLLMAKLGAAHPHDPVILVESHTFALEQGLQARGQRPVFAFLLCRGYLARLQVSGLVGLEVELALLFLVVRAEKSSQQQEKQRNGTQPEHRPSLLPFHQRATRAFVAGARLTNVTWRVPPARGGKALQSSLHPSCPAWPSLSPQVGADIPG